MINKIKKLFQSIKGRFKVDNSKKSNAVSKNINSNFVNPPKLIYDISFPEIKYDKSRRKSKDRWYQACDEILTDLVRKEINDFKDHQDQKILTVTELSGNSLPFHRFHQIRMKIKKSYKEDFDIIFRVKVKGEMKNIVWDTYDLYKFYIYITRK